jgi:hypothetical protein
LILAYLWRWFHQITSAGEIATTWYGAHSNMNFHPGTCTIFLALILSACLPPAPAGSTPTAALTNPWGAALRALDPADAADPALDITAVYLKQEEGSLLVRVDLLDFQNPGQVRIEIQVADVANSGRKHFPIIVNAPDERFPMQLDPALDTVTVEIFNDALPANPRIDVLTPQDAVADLRPDGPVPSGSAPLLLTFYEAFPGRFPAEALRSWDGAHSGPRGERHGLKHLVAAAETYQTPVVLLDLKDPESLSALDAMGQLPHLRKLAENGLLVLPRVVGESTGFDLPGSATCFADSGDTQKKCPVSFQFQEDAGHIRRWYRFPFQATTSIPIADGSTGQQPGASGPSLEVRSALLEIALNDDPLDLLALGGSLPQSNWGDPDMAGPTLAYFASRPYIRLLDEGDLLAFPALAGRPQALPSPTGHNAEELADLYAGLTRPIQEFAAGWDGAALAECGRDLDRDGQPECLLADERLLAVLDPQGARLTYLFAREDSVSHQLVGPSWEVATGLSNAALWDVALGEAADPGALPGAFAELDEPFLQYSAAVEGGTLNFISQDGMRIKTFRLTDSGLEVNYRLQEPLTAHIALLVDPWTRFYPGWAGRYVGEKTSSGLRWGLKDGPMVALGADIPLDIKIFNENMDLLSIPEDPDLEYPPGYTLPFPMVLVTALVEGQARFILSLIE